MRPEFHQDGLITPSDAVTGFAAGAIANAATRKAKTKKARTRNEDEARHNPPQTRANPKKDNRA
jgi:hypothetical protein